MGQFTSNEFHFVAYSWTDVEDTTIAGSWEQLLKQNIVKLLSIAKFGSLYTYLDTTIFTFLLLLHSLNSLVGNFVQIQFV